MSESSKSTVTIGVFALLSGLSIEALRHYHEVGLLVPDHVDPATGYRRYGREQVRRAQAIRLLRSLDMPITHIAEVLTCEDPDSVRKALSEHRDSLVATSDALERKIERIDELIKKGEVMPATVSPRIIGLSVMGPDVEALRAFYERVFGMEFVGEDHGWGLHYHATGGAFAAPDGLFLFTLWGRYEGWENAKARLEMYVSGVDDVYQRALAAGGESVNVPFDSGHFPRSAIFTDVGGNVIQIYETDQQ